MQRPSTPHPCPGIDSPAPHDVRRRRRPLRAVIVALGTVIALLPACATAQPEGRVIEYANGRWFDGTAFVERTLYSVGETFAEKRPARVDSVVDVAGGFVVPPFAEAHNHNVESSRFDAINRTYLEQGIFYVKNPNSLERFTEPIRERLVQGGTIDATFAGGGLTCTGGHPIEIADRMIGFGRWTDDDGDGGFYWILDDLDDVERRWDDIAAQKRDFLKTYLMYSEDQAARLADSTTAGARGLSPEVFHEVVRRAREAGIPVSVHVETAADFHEAVMAGVDEVNHMPGFRPEESVPIDRYRIADADAAMAAEKDIGVVTTLGSLIMTLDQLEASGESKKDVELYRDLVRSNLRVLKSHGVKIAAGSDSYEKSSLFEVLELEKTGVFTPAELLRLWSETSAQAIFPGRKIGRLAEGFEASFLVLDASPLEDFQNVTRIRMRVKQGEAIELPPAD